MRKVWPDRTQSILSFIRVCRSRKTTVSPRYALSNGVEGSPWTRLLKIFEASGLLANRLAMGSALKFNPLPVVCVPPFRNGMGVIAIFSGIMKDTVLPPSKATSTGWPGGFPAVTIFTVCGTVSCTCTTNSLKLPFTP